MYKLLLPEDKTKLDAIERFVTKQFSLGMPSNAYFTLHGPPHIKSVIGNLNSLRGNSKIKINKKEAFLLLAAAWLHDIGMIDGRITSYKTFFHILP